MNILQLFFGTVPSSHVVTVLRFSSYPEIVSGKSSFVYSWHNFLVSLITCSGCWVVKPTEILGCLPSVSFDMTNLLVLIGLEQHLRCCCFLSSLALSNHFCSNIFSLLSIHMVGSKTLLVSPNICRNTCYCYQWDWYKCEHTSFHYMKVWLPSWLGNLCFEQVDVALCVIGSALNCASLGLGTLPDHVVAMPGSGVSSCNSFIVVAITIVFCRSLPPLLQELPYQQPPLQFLVPLYNCTSLPMCHCYRNLWNT